MVTMALQRKAISPRKEPRQGRALATWTAILDAAAHVLEAQGLDGFNTNAVAARAGVSIGSLYQYLPNKDALMAALIAREQEARAEALTGLARVLAAAPVEIICKTLVTAAVSGEAKRPRLARCLDQEEARLQTDAVGEAAGRRIDAALLQLLGPHLAHLAEERQREAVRTLRITARALVDDALNGPSPSAERAARTAEEVLVAYLHWLGAERGIA
jgi:AcrR family transcriptional regulator